MSASPEPVYAMATSLTGRVYVLGFRNGIVEVRDWQSRSALARFATVNDQETARIALSDDGLRLATAGYYSGIEMWDWRVEKRLWALPRAIPVHRIGFQPGEHGLLAELDNKGVWFLEADSGAMWRTVRGIGDVVISPHEPILFGKQQKELAVYDLVSMERRWSAPEGGFGVLSACFTPRQLVVAETGGLLRSFALGDGRETILSAAGGRWSALTHVACVGRAEEVVAWASVGMGAEAGMGELVRFCLREGAASRIVSHGWMWARPVDAGRKWVFQDGTVQQVEGRST